MISPSAVDVEERLSEKTKPIREATLREQRARRELLYYLSFSSPAMLMQTALEEIAGSGVNRHAHFEAQVEDFMRDTRRTLQLNRQRQRMSVTALGTYQSLSIRPSRGLRSAAGLFRSSGYLACSPSLWWCSRSQGYERWVA